MFYLKLKIQLACSLSKNPPREQPILHNWRPIEEFWEIGTKIFQCVGAAFDPTFWKVCLVCLLSFPLFFYLFILACVFILPKIFLTENKNWKYMLQQYNEILNLGSKNISPSLDSSAIFEHIFFCKRLYDPENGAIKKVDKFPLVYSNPFINSTS